MKVLSTENFACNVRMDGVIVNCIFYIGENEFYDDLWALLAEKAVIKTLLESKKLRTLPVPPAVSLSPAVGDAPLPLPSLTPETKRPKRRRK